MTGNESISARDATLFQQLVDEYKRIIVTSLTSQSFAEAEPSSDTVVFAQRLGELRASPRDLVEVHGAGMQQCRASEDPHRYLAIAEEGRILLLEVMGYLTGYYRKFALRMEAELGHIKDNGG